MGLSGLSLQAVLDYARERQRIPVRILPRLAHVASQTLDVSVIDFKNAERTSAEPEDARLAFVFNKEDEDMISSMQGLVLGKQICDRGELETLNVHRPSRTLDNGRGCLHFLEGGRRSVN